MRQLFVVIFGLFSLAMGGQKPDVPQPGMASPEPYHQKFKELGQSYGAAFITNSITFSFGWFFGSTIGMCRMSGNGRNSIQFSSSAWSQGSDTFREMLSFHEMGHCLLGRGHKNSRLSSGKPESLMNSWLFDSKTYLANRDQYLKELFTANFSPMAVQHLGAKQFDDCGFMKGRRRGE
jgi:hypothetical protein